MDPRSAFEALRSEFESVLAEALAAAQNARQQGQAWVRICERWTGAAPTSFVKDSGAGHPADVRALLRALERSFVKRMSVLDAQLTNLEDDDLEDEVWEFARTRLPQFAEAELATYTQRVAPRPSVGALFAKAAKPKAPGSSAAAGPAVQTLNCRGCGSPRAADNQYGRCLFCGMDFFSPKGG